MNDYVDLLRNSASAIVSAWKDTWSALDPGDQIQYGLLCLDLAEQEEEIRLSKEDPPLLDKAQTERLVELAERQAEIHVNLGHFGQLGLCPNFACLMASVIRFGL